MTWVGNANVDPYNTHLVWCN